MWIAIIFQLLQSADVNYQFDFKSITIAQMNVSETESRINRLSGSSVLQHRSTWIYRLPLKFTGLYHVAELQSSFAGKWLVCLVNTKTTMSQPQIKVSTPRNTECRYQKSQNTLFICTLGNLVDCFRVWSSLSFLQYLGMMYLLNSLHFIQSSEPAVVLHSKRQAHRHDNREDKM